MNAGDAGTSPLGCRGRMAMPERASCGNGHASDTADDGFGFTRHGSGSGDERTGPNSVLILRNPADAATSEPSLVLGLRTEA